MRRHAILIAALGMLAFGHQATADAAGPCAATEGKARKQCQHREMRRRAAAKLADSSFSYMQGSASALGPVFTERYEFCRGSFTHVEVTSAFGPPEYRLTSSYRGTWRVTKASRFAGETRMTIAVTTSGFTSTNIDGSPGGGTPPDPTGRIRVRFRGAVGYFDSLQPQGRIWRRATDAAC